MVFINSLSNSKEDTFDQCKFKYLAKYVDHIDPTTEVNDGKMVFGNFIHRIFELGYKATTFKELHDIADSIRSTYKFDRSLEPKIEVCFKNFLAFSAGLPKDNQPLPEWFYQIQLTEDIIYQGVIDRLILGKDNGLLIIDWKTGAHEKSKGDLLDDPQLLGYALAAHLKFKVPFSKITCAHYYPVTDHFINIRYNKAQVLTFVREKKDKVWTIRKLRKSELMPCKNEYCNQCEYKALCPLFGGSKILYEQALKDKKEYDPNNRYGGKTPELLKYEL
jgi:RecB family exonuclease